MTKINDEAAVRAAFEEYLRCTNLHDFDAVEPCIASDAVYKFGIHVYVGRSAIRRAFEAAWARIEDEHYGAEDVHLVGLHGDQAVLSYRYHWIGRVGGRMSKGGGQGTNLLCREGDRWLMAYEQLSLGAVVELTPTELLAFKRL